MLRNGPQMAQPPPTRLGLGPTVALALAMAVAVAASPASPRAPFATATAAFAFSPQPLTGIRHQGCAPTAPFSSSSSSSSLRMIGNLPGISGGKEGPSLPRDVKSAVSDCRAAVQMALEGRISRMDVEMPVGADYSIEKGNGRGGKRKGGGRGHLADLASDGDATAADGMPTMDQLERSDRELARLFVEMFQPLGGEHISVVFRDEGLAGTARQRWKGDAGAECRVLAVDRKGKRSSNGMGGGGKKKKKNMGFAAKMAAEIEGDGASGAFALPDGTEVALFVAPGPKELIAVERICSQVGMGTCVILLNARLSKVDNFGTDDAKELFVEKFESVFHLAAAPQEGAPGCLLHRAYPSEWILARKPKVGSPKTIATYPQRPTLEQCAEAYDSIEITDMEKTTDNVIDNVASWFK